MRPYYRKGEWVWYQGTLGQVTLIHNEPFGYEYDIHRKTSLLSGIPEKDLRKYYVPSQYSMGQLIAWSINV